MSPSAYSLLADGVLLLHFAFVLFVVLGLIVIWAGWFFGWSFVRNFYFRLAHLIAMGFVVAETLLGIVCPLTTWEARLRWLAGEGERYAGSFMQHWIHRIMFFELSEGAFKVIYVLFFLLIVASLVVVKPRPPGRIQGRGR